MIAVVRRALDGIDSTFQQIAFGKAEIGSNARHVVRFERAGRLLVADDRLQGRLDRCRGRNVSCSIIR
jgi:hypothetical protein